MAKVSLLTAKSQIGFQNFVLAICHWVRNPDQDAQQIFKKIGWIQSA